MPARAVTTLVTALLRSASWNKPTTPYSSLMLGPARTRPLVSFLVNFPPQHNQVLRGHAPVRQAWSLVRLDIAMAIGPTFRWVVGNDGGSVFTMLVMRADQRGVARPQGRATDIGAFEREAG